MKGLGRYWFVRRSELAKWGKHSIVFYLEAQILRHFLLQDCQCCFYRTSDLRCVQYELCKTSDVSVETFYIVWWKIKQNWRKEQVDYWKIFQIINKRAMSIFTHYFPPKNWVISESRQNRVKSPTLCTKAAV